MGHLDVYRSAFVGRLAQGQQFVNGVFFVQEAATLSDPVATLGALLAGWAAENYPNLMTNSCVLDKVEIRQVTGSPLYGADFPVNESGAGTGAMLPPQCAPVMAWYTNRVGHDQHGRIYLPAPGDDKTVSGTLSDAYKSAVNSIFGTLRQMFDPDDSEQLDFTQVIFHRGTGLYDRVQGNICRPYTQTQRRRVVGRGS